MIILSFWLYLELIPDIIIFEIGLNIIHTVVPPLPLIYHSMYIETEHLTHISSFSTTRHFPDLFYLKLLLTWQNKN